SISSITKGDTTFVRYMVEPGETIYGISTAYGISISELMDLNPELENGLKVGQIISIPYKKEKVEKHKKKVKDNVHVVQPGETLYSLSRKYDVTIGDLLKWNGMELQAGQEVVVGQEVVNETKTISKTVDTKTTTPTATAPKPKDVVTAPKSTTQTTPEVQNAEIPKPMTQAEILASEEIYDYDSTMQQVLIIPFDPHLYFSDADDELAKASRIPRTKVREVFRRRLDALLEPDGYECIHLLGGQFADSVADLNKIYTSVNYNYQEILYSDNYATNVPEASSPQKKDKSFKNWVNRQKEKVDGSTNEKAADRFEGKYFGVRVKDMSFFEFYHYKYSVDYYVFINQFEVVTDYENCLDRAAKNYARYFITHFTVFNKDGKQIAGNKFKVYYDSNTSDVNRMAADNMQKVAQRVINELPKLRKK
ncbi:LysM peptidoglycan-binding domain-containing protein, partial [Cyclobacteriaceae bacterium]|nr:LysM peptidoglycan-binding domain-containing protein [Cyclobacteriaceae bacterium]